MSLEAPRWPRESPTQCSERLGISLAAAELFGSSEVIDLHIDSFIWVRLLGYRLDERHGPGTLRARYYRQVDLPRLRQVGVGGATWVITTNPLRSASGRRRALTRNLKHLEALLSADASDVAVVTNHSSYLEARAKGLHAAFLGLQGGNAVDEGPDALLELAPQRVLRVTLVHLYSSRWGTSSAPLSNLHRESLTAPAKDAVAWLNQERIFVDLAHISRAGFFAGLDVHDPSVPPIVTHTGVCGRHAHWRNLDDAQIRAIADRGGVVGIMYHGAYLDGAWGRGSLRAIVDHIEHVIAVAGEHVVALGSDWDGLITTPTDMPTCLELPRLVQEMLDRRWTPTRIQNVLGLNFLRCLRDLRG
jgi:membrane dipeptidase